jgi:hypothetical protein
MAAALPDGLDVVAVAAVIRERGALFRRLREAEEAMAEHLDRLVRHGEGLKGTVFSRV